MGSVKFLRCYRVLLYALFLCYCQSLMAEWLEMYCHDQEVMGLSPGQVEIGVCIVLLSKLYLNQNFQSD